MSEPTMRYKVYREEEIRPRVGVGEFYHPVYLGTRWVPLREYENVTLKELLEHREGDRDLSLKICDMSENFVFYITQTPTRFVPNE